MIDKVTFIANPELFNIPYTYFLKIPSTIELKSIQIVKISDQIYAEFEPTAWVAHGSGNMYSR